LELGALSAPSKASRRGHVLRLVGDDTAAVRKRFWILQKHDNAERANASE
jgi:hypothetical protein